MSLTPPPPPPPHEHRGPSGCKASGSVSGKASGKAKAALSNGRRQVIGLYPEPRRPPTQGSTDSREVLSDITNDLSTTAMTQRLLRRAVTAPGQLGPMTRSRSTRRPPTINENSLTPTTPTAPRRVATDPARRAASPSPSPFGPPSSPPQLPSPTLAPLRTALPPLRRRRTAPVPRLEEGVKQDDAEDVEGTGKRRCAGMR